MKKNEKKTANSFLLGTKNCSFVCWFHGECPRKLWFLVFLVHSHFLFASKRIVLCTFWIRVCLCVNVKLSRQVWKVYLEFKHLYLNNKPYNDNNENGSERKTERERDNWRKCSFRQEKLLVSFICRVCFVCNLWLEPARRTLQKHPCAGCVRDAGTIHQWKTEMAW